MRLLIYCGTQCNTIYMSLQAHEGEAYMRRTVMDIQHTLYHTC